MTYELHHGDCIEVLRTIPASSIDAVITDPPYPEVSRDYGRLTEDQWWSLMMDVCAEVRRVLKPAGSAVFILRPNSRKVGSMRPWLWRFMYWTTTEWNMIQDAYWWNYVALPVSGAPSLGLMRPSVKPCVWAGPPACYRNQSAVMWRASQSAIARAKSNLANNAAGRRDTAPSGRSVHTIKRYSNVNEGASTPFNLLPIETDGFRKTGGAKHGAVTPLALADWWTRYICPAGGAILDPFNGSGTMGIAAMQNGCSYIGIDKERRYIDESHERLAKAQPALLREPAE